MLRLEFSKDKVLEVIKENRETHIEIADEAKENYQKALIEKLEEMLTNAKDGKKVKRTIDLVEPADFRQEYDRAISMLEMAEVDTIALSEDDYSRYVQDDWEWKRQFALANSGYTVGKF